MNVHVFQKGETIRIWVFNRTWAEVYTSPDQGVRVIVTDPNEVIKVSAVSVIASASFTVGLTVTGGTSGATGVVTAKPDGTTLLLEEVTGIWQSGEAITDPGAGTSTTSSILIGASMTESEAGMFFYDYNSQTDDAEGWWTCKSEGQEGTGADAKIVIDFGGFRLK